MPSAYAGTRSKYYAQLKYIVNWYGYKKKFTSKDVNIDGKVLAAMYDRGLFDREPSLGGKSRVIKVYTIKKDIFDQVCKQEKREQWMQVLTC